MDFHLTLHGGLESAAVACGSPACGYWRARLARAHHGGGEQQPRVGPGK